MRVCVNITCMVIWVKVLKMLRIKPIHILSCSVSMFAMIAPLLAITACCIHVVTLTMAMEVERSKVMLISLWYTHVVGPTRESGTARARVIK